MGIFSKIKKWFTGGNTRSNTRRNYNSYSTSKKGLSSGTTYTAYKAQLNKQKKEEERKKKQLQQAFKASSKKVTTDKNTTATKSSGSEKALEKIRQKTYEQKNTASPKAAIQPKETNAYKQKQKASVKKVANTLKPKESNYSKTVRKDLGMTKDELMFQNKLGTNQDVKVADVNYMAKNNPTLTPLARGAMKGLSLGGYTWAENKAADNGSAVAKAVQENANNYGSGLTKAEEDARFNAFKYGKAYDSGVTEDEFKGRLSNRQQNIETASEVVGNLVTFMATGGMANAVGSGIAKKIAPNAVEKIATMPIVQSIAKKKGVEAISIADRLAKGLATDLGVNVTTGNVQALMSAANTDGDVGDKAKEYLKQMGINVLLGATIEGVGSGLKSAKSYLKSQEDNLYRLGLTNENIGDDIARYIKDEDKQIIERNTQEIKTLENYKQALRENWDKAGKEERIEINKEVASADELIKKYSDEISDITYKAEMAQTRAEILEAKQAGRATTDIDQANAEKIIAEEQNATTELDEFTASDNAVADEIVKEEQTTAELDDFTANDIETAKAIETEEKTEAKAMIDEAVQQTPKKVEQTAPATADDIDNMVGIGEQTTLKDVNKKPPRKKRETKPLKMKPEDKLSKGTKKVAKALGSENISPITEKEIHTATEHWSRNYGSGALGKDGTATSKAYVGLMKASKNKVERTVMEAMMKLGGADYKIVTHDEATSVLRDVMRDPYKYIEKCRKVAKGEAVEINLKGFNEKSLRRLHAESIATLQYCGEVLNEAVKTKNIDPKLLKAFQRDYEAAFIATKDIASQSGGTLELQRYYSRLSPETRARVALKDAAEMLDKNAKFRRDFENDFGIKLKEGTSKEDIAIRRRQIESALKKNEEFMKKLEYLEGKNAEATKRVEELVKEVESLNVKKQELLDVASNLKAERDGYIKKIEKLKGVMKNLKADTKAYADKANELEKLIKKQENLEGRYASVNEEMAGIDDSIAEAENGIRANEAGGYLNEKESSEAYTAALNEATKMMKMSLLDYVQEWRYLAMLGNPKTHIRNRVGNILFKGIRTTSNAFASSIEKQAKNSIKADINAWSSEIKSGNLSKNAETFLSSRGLTYIPNEATLNAVIDEVPKLKGKLKVGDFVSVSGAKHTKEYAEKVLRAYEEELSVSTKAGLSPKLYADCKRSKRVTILDADGNPVKNKLGIVQKETIPDPKTEVGKVAAEAYSEIKDIIAKGSKMDIRNTVGKQRTNLPLLKRVTRIVEGASNFNSDMLELADKQAISMNFRETFCKLAEKNNLMSLAKDSDEYKLLYGRLVEESTEEALIATFRDTNKFAGAISRAVNKMYEADASFGEKAVALATNAIVPFAKTPANVLKQTFNYSPYGIIKGYSGIKKAAMSGDVTALNKAVDHLASGVTGTGILALGLGMGLMTDAIVTNAGNDEVAKFKKRQGVQDYSVIIGDHSYTLDWLSPVATAFFVGAEVANQIKEGNGLDTRDIYDLAVGTAELSSRLIEPVLEMSMLSGINNTFGGLSNNYNSDSEKIGAIPKLLSQISFQYINSMIPTLQGQVARAVVYESDKQLTGDNAYEYQLNSLRNKMGLANRGKNPLGAKTDSFGNIVNPKSVGKALNVLLNPSNVQKVNITKADEKLIDEYNDLIKNGIKEDEAKKILPRPNYNKAFDVGRSKDTKVNVTMSNVELSGYNQSRATGGADAMASALESIMFNRYETNSNGDKVLKDGYTKEQKQKLIKQYEGKSTEEVMAWLLDTPQFKNASDYEQKLVLSTMFDNAGAKAKGNRRTAERSVWVAQGKDGNKYDFLNELSAKKQEKLQDAIDSKIVTYEEAVDFARNAGKTYYYEDEDGGGSSQTYYNKAEMIAYLKSKGYSNAKAEALYNAFKNANAKAYGSSSSGGGGWGGYRRGGSSRGSSGVSVGKLKTSAYKADTFKPRSATATTKSSSSLKELLENMDSQAGKITPPKNK